MTATEASPVRPQDHVGQTLYAGYLAMIDQPDWTSYFLTSEAAVAFIRRAHRAPWSRAIERAEVWSLHPTCLGVMDTEQRFVTCR